MPATFTRRECSSHQRRVRRPEASSLLMTRPSASFHSRGGAVRGGEVSEAAGRGRATSAKRKSKGAIARNVPDTPLPLARTRSPGACSSPLLRGVGRKEYVPRNWRCQAWNMHSDPNCFNCMSGSPIRLTVRRGGEGEGGRQSWRGARSSRDRRDSAGAGTGKGRPPAFAKASAGRRPRAARVARARAGRDSTSRARETSPKASRSSA